MQPVAKFLRREFGRNGRCAIAFALIAAALVAAPLSASAAFIQQGPKLVGEGATGNAAQGGAVAVSGDGNFAIFGGIDDNSEVGAAWVFKRVNGVWTEQNKLVGSNAVGAARQGESVALSADGKTAIVGGNGDSSYTGAAWIFTQIPTSIGYIWSEQAKLVGTGGIGETDQGGSVALSADGNTAIVGGYHDNSEVGAAWVFTRSGTTWTQQAKLVGSGGVGPGGQGFSVGLSADGNTAILGAPDDNNKSGAAWIFVRDGSGVWSQQGDKIVGKRAVGQASQGWAVAMSGDGNTAMVGGIGDNSNAGAVWVFIRRNGVWRQQGNKLIGTGTGYPDAQGVSVSLAADGNTALVGSEDGGGVGAAWVFRRNNGVWTQLGNKLVGAGAVGEAQQAVVSLSGDGATALLGGLADNSYVGAAWVFTRQLASHDFDADANSDILWRNGSTGGTLVWEMNGGTAKAKLNAGRVSTAWQVAGAGDFDGDHKADILWHNASTGQVMIWEMDGGTVRAKLAAGRLDTAWQIAGTGDFDADGRSDILWYNKSTGGVLLWEMIGGTVKAKVNIGKAAKGWQIAATADFDGDGTTDILWHNKSTGSVSLWAMNAGTGTVKVKSNAGQAASSWRIVGAADFDGDGKADILWFNASTRIIAIWEMDGATATSKLNAGQIPAGHKMAAVGDFDGDGNGDILWSDNAGNLLLWEMTGATVKAKINAGAESTAWQIQP